MIKYGTIAQAEYTKTVGKSPGLTAKQKSTLLTDIVPYADKDSLPAHYRAKLAQSFIPEIKKQYPDAGWAEFDPTQAQRFGGTTRVEMQQMLATVRSGKLKLTPENNLLLLKIMGYPEDVQDKIKGKINKASEALGKLQTEALRIQKEVNQAKAARGARKKLDQQERKEAKKSKVQLARKRSKRAQTPPARGEKSITRIRRSAREREESPEPREMKARAEPAVQAQNGDLELPHRIQSQKLDMHQKPPPRQKTHGDKSVVRLLSKTVHLSISQVGHYILFKRSLSL